ncbi:nucleolar GTP-binding protein [Nematocida homosporus]|uniref:nucleolar GTP-binding protein n=1 Tax=Nematocida homosporus TaxID=1912981 RepID=UPI002220DC69|nr:nucleolar GTP-binding protein [Nematocida homosporus]KAI5185242.1 nucleolar GTP-binding protein [Nematocida homosporus]
MNIKSIVTVPTAEVLIDACLSKTNRKTPTEVHRHYKIGRIREFYTRKVKFACTMYTSKLNEILEAFPKVDEIHPFTSDLINVLYDRDHYKMALGHIKTVSSSISRTQKEYTKLIKYGDTLYRCKQLKRAALGKMSTMAKKLGKTLVYLEEVRQSLMRMPDIDPSTRTLLICGYPNVGKSSFMNSVSRAKVDIQPYAFTTRNLYVGHFDYKYLRWQIIDTPGVLDHPIEEMNTIEMQSVTALAHLRAAVLYFIDVSETCGYSIECQLGLFRSLSPLFEGKPVVFILSKSDAKRISELPSETQTLIKELIADNPWVEISSLAESNIDMAKNMACEYLLDQRVEIKLQEKRLEEFRAMLDIRKPEIDPEYKRVAQTDEFGTRTETQKQLKEEARQRGEKFFSDLNKSYFVAAEWKYDAIPEIMNGKNIADFIDPEIEAKLLKLEEEEDYYLQEVYGREYNLLHPSEKDKKQKIMHSKIVHRLRGMNKQRSSIPERMKFAAETKKLATKAAQAQEAVAPGAPMEVELRKEPERQVLALTPTQRNLLAFKDTYVKEKKLKGRKSESDRIHLTERPKHLFSGKTGRGKRQYR